MDTLYNSFCHTSRNAVADVNGVGKKFVQNLFPKFFVTPVAISLNFKLLYILICFLLCVSLQEDSTRAAFGRMVGLSAAEMD